MRIGLIGCSYHWGAFQRVLKELPGAEVVAVAPGGPGEKSAGFERRSSVPASAKRYEDPRALLDREKLDFVQVSTDFETMGRWNLEAARRGIPFASEKPMALDLETLAALHETVVAQRVPLYAMQGTRGVRAFCAAGEALRDGRVGVPYASYHQKSYIWGERPDVYKDPRRFPGLVPWVGIHALSWMHWLLGDIFLEVSGCEGHEGRPEYRGCATQAGLVFRQRNGGSALLSLDYLRPAAAPTHGDERCRIAGSQGVVEVIAAEERCTLVTASEGPRPIEPAGKVEDPYVQFARSLDGSCKAPVEVREAFRVTELAFLAQRAATSGKAVTLTPSPYAAPA